MIKTKDKKSMTREEEMFHRILDSKKRLFSRKVSKDYIVTPTSNLALLTENMKPSIVTNTAFKTMMNSSKRLKYPAKIFSCFFGEDPKELVKGMNLYKDELDKEKIDDKEERVDFVCKYGNAKWQIEMNNNSSEKVMERNIDYLCKLYVEDNKIGNKNIFYPVLQIDLNNFSFEGDDTTIDIFPIQNSRHEVLTDKIIFVMIYIPNLYKKMYNYGIDSLTELERCILAMVDEDIELSKKLSVGDDIMCEFVKDAKGTSNNSDFREDYTLEFRAKEDGIALGIEQKAREVVIAMLKNGEDMNKIVQYTDLSVEEIEEIKKEINSN